jgi:aspartate racemase
MGWQSTILYYERLNQLAHTRMGKHHSADIVLRSPDYQRIKRFAYDQIEERGAVLANELSALALCNPDCILICNNTLHKAYDDVKARLDLRVPVLHIVNEVGKYLAANSMKSVLLLGTQFTMEDGFFAEGLRSHGISCRIPDAGVRNDMQKIQEKLLREGPDQEMKTWYKKLIMTYDDTVDAVVLACTELPLIISPSDIPFPVVDSVDVHCKAAIAFALGSDS